MTATVHIDGAARGNPGPAACAYVIARSGAPVVELAERLGTATNNVAEYTALVRVLGKLADLGVKTAVIHSDSELLVKQMNGEYRVKNEDLLVLYEQAQVLLKKLERVQIVHVRRAQNARADELCNIALDGKAAAKVPGAKSSEPGTRKPVPVNDDAVRDDAVVCLESAARAWARGNANDPPPAAVWEQLWSLLEETGVLKKR